MRLQEILCYINIKRMYVHIVYSLNYMFLLPETYDQRILRNSYKLRNYKNTLKSDIIYDMSYDWPDSGYYEYYD